MQQMCNNSQQEIFGTMHKITVPLQRNYKSGPYYSTYLKKQTMKRNLLKVAFAALCLLGIQSFTGMSQILAENIILRPITPTPPPSNDDGTPPHRAPQQSVVSAVEINDACDELTSPWIPPEACFSPFWH